MLLILFTSLTGFAQDERILDYHTQIEVSDDRSILVTETIKVHVEGMVFKRGITRYLPTSRYLNDKLVNVRYDIKKVEKDGVKEPYHSAGQGQGIVLYLGFNQAAETTRQLGKRKGRRLVVNLVWTCWYLLDSLD